MATRNGQPLSDYKLVPTLSRGGAGIALITSSDSTRTWPPPITMTSSCFSDPSVAKDATSVTVSFCRSRGANTSVTTLPSLNPYRANSVWVKVSTSPTLAYKRNFPHSTLSRGHVIQKTSENASCQGMARGETAILAHAIASSSPNVQLPVTIPSQGLCYHLASR